MKVLFVNDSTSSSNWGDRAAAVSLMEMTRQSGGHIIHSITEQNIWDSSFEPPAPGFSTSAQPRSRELARRWLAPVALDTRRWLLSKRKDGGQDQHTLIPSTWDDFEAAAERVVRQSGHGWPLVLRAMQEADVMLIHGASLHGNLLIPRTILFLTYLAKSRFGTPVVIANHTADLTDPVLRRIAEHVYPLFDDVVFRDPFSAEQLASLCDGRYAGDTAFWFEPATGDDWAAVSRRFGYFDVWPDEASFDTSAPYVCLGGSSIFHDRRDWSSLADSYATLVERLQSVYEGTIVLTASAELDEPLFRALARRYGLPLVGVRTPVQQAVDIVGNADAYIGGRWHPSIFALRGGTPLVALSSQTFKMRALTGMPGTSPCTFDALDPARDIEGIARQLACFLEDGSLRARVREWADGMARQIWGNVAYLAADSEQGAAEAR
jgi:hypothetical protein